MHVPYEKILGHPPDFKVKYRFYSKEEGGRTYVPYQGYRSDFWYGNGKPGELFIIWPEFENAQDEIILRNNSAVPESGTARMWIIMPERRVFHKGKIKVGLVGFFMEGLRKVAKCQVIEIIGLNTNSVQTKHH